MWWRDVFSFFSALIISLRLGYLKAYAQVAGRQSAFQNSSGQMSSSSLNYPVVLKNILILIISIIKIIIKMVMLLALCLMIIKICNFKKIGINSEKVWKQVRDQIVSKQGEDIVVIEWK